MFLDNMDLPCYDEVDAIIPEEDIEYISIPAWRMRNGKLIAIRDMDTTHIENCIKMIQRSNYTWRSQYLRYFKSELRTRQILEGSFIIYEE